MSPCGANAGGGGGPEPQLSNIVISKSGFGFKLCEFILFRNGNLSVDGSQRSNEWLLSADKETTIGDDYEVRVIKTGGNLTLSGITNNLWTDLSAVSRTCNAGTSGSGTYDGTIEIREKSDTSNSASAIIDFNIT